MKPRTKPMRRVSPDAWWPPLRAKAKVAFARVGSTICEFRYTGCWRDNGLGFAHSLKRRNITTEEQKREVALACPVCHEIIELLKEETMAETVRRVIEERPVKIIIP